MAKGWICRQLRKLVPEPVPPEKLDFEPTSLGEAITELKAFVKRTSAAFREGHELSAKSHEQTARTLVWLTGLMGAGIFSVQGLLVGAPWAARLSILVPWAAGIFCGVASTLAGSELQNGLDRQHFRRVHMLSLLEDVSDLQVIRKVLRPLIDSGVLARDPENQTLDCLAVVVNGFFYLAHIFFMVGVVATVTTVATGRG